jgi:acetyl esterase/lipase
LYIPPCCDDDTPKPVVIFVTGGAWIIGLVGSLFGGRMPVFNLPVFMHIFFI